MNADERPTLLVISGGVEAVPGIRRAQEMGVFVVVSDGANDAPGFSMADDSIRVSTYDVDGTVKAASEYSDRQRRIDGVMSIASDVPVTVAGVADALGLAGPSLETARLVADKVAMKCHLVSGGVPVPWFKEVASVGDLRSRAAVVGYPLVIKPVDSRGARGVLLLRGFEDELAAAFEAAKSFSATGRVMIERFIAGPQLSTESLISRGVAHTVGIADRNYDKLERFAPFIIEDGGQLPSELPGSQLGAVREVIQRAVDSLGVESGVIKGDIVLDGGVPVVIEVALRLSGGYLCTHEIPLSTGVDFVGLAVQIALGEEPAEIELQPSLRRGVAQRWLFPEPGRVTGVQGVEAVAARPEIEMCEIRVAPGDLVPPLENHPGRAGVVIATGGDRQGAIDNAVRAVSDISIDTVPTGDGALG